MDKPSSGGHCAPSQTERHSISWLTNPDVGRALLFLFLAVLPVIFTTHTMEVFEYPKSMWLRVCALCFTAPGLLVGWRLLASWRSRGAWRTLWRRLTTDLMTVGVLLFLASAVVSTGMSLSPRISWWGETTSYAGLAMMLAAAVMYFAAGRLGSSPAHIEHLVLACVLAGLVAAAFSFLQMAGVDSVGWQFTSNAGAFMRPFGTMGHPNHQGALLAMVLPLVLGLAGPGRQRWLVVTGLVLVVGLAVTVSRGAWLGWAAAMVIWGAVRLRSYGFRVPVRKTIYGLAAGVLTLSVLVWWGPQGILSGLHDRVANMTSAMSRLHIWDTSLRIFRDHPVLGVGPDMFPYAFAPRRTTAFWDQEWNTIPTHAHNELLQVLATQGILGGLGLLVFVVGLLQASRRALRHPDPQSRRLGVALVGSVAAFLVLSLFSFTSLGYGPLFLVLAALVNRLGSWEHGTSPPPLAGEGESRGRWFQPALVTAAGLLVLHFVWNLSMGLEEAPPAFWLAIVVLGATICGTTAVMLRLWPASKQPESNGTGTFADSLATLSRGRIVEWLAVGAGAVGLVFLVVLPWYAHMLCARGNMALEHDIDRALVYFHDAVAMDPSWDIYWVHLAQAYQSRGGQAKDPAERRAYLGRARAAWELLAARCPVYGFHHDNLGICRSLQCQDGVGTPDEVFAAFDTAIRLDPTNVLIYADAADAALRLGRRDQAWDYAQTGFRSQGKDTHYGPLDSQLGHVFLERGAPYLAMLHLKKALVGHWNTREEWRDTARANLVLALYRLRRFTDLMEVATEFLADHPGASAIRIMLAEAQERWGLADAAYRNYRYVLEQLPQHRLARAGCERLRGAVSHQPVSAERNLP